MLYEFKKSTQGGPRPHRPSCTFQFNKVLPFHLCTNLVPEPDGGREEDSARVMPHRVAGDDVVADLQDHIHKFSFTENVRGFFSTEMTKKVYPRPRDPASCPRISVHATQDTLFLAISVVC